jgi:hypothetical protein
MARINGVRTRAKKRPARTTAFLFAALAVAATCLTVTAAAGAGGNGNGNGNGNGKISLVPPTRTTSTSTLLPTPSNPSKLASPSKGGGGGGTAGPPAPNDPVVPGPSLHMKVLLITTDPNPNPTTATDSYGVMQTLSQIGIPFDIFDAKTQTLTPDVLSTNGVGNYQAIILDSNYLYYSPDGGATWTSAFDPTEWSTLWSYEAQYHVRSVTWYTDPFCTDFSTPPPSGSCNPGDDNFSYGLTPSPGYVDTTSSPLSVTLTGAGQSTFWYLNQAASIQIKYAWVYLPKIADPSTTTPLVQDAAGDVIASIHKFSDGRQNLAVTADNASWLLHSQLFSYGLVSWATHGVFLGERHVNMDAQVDDLLIDDDMWDPNCNCDQPSQGAKTSPFRAAGGDLNTLVSWQKAQRTSSPLLASLTLEFPFNGWGAVAGNYAKDTLTPAVKRQQSNFNWVNHTFTHANLDYGAVDDTGAPVDFTAELRKNDDMATTLGFTRGVNYFKDGFVQPDISGLGNTDFQNAAKNFGIKYLISDASRPGWSNPTPNAGFYSENLGTLTNPDTGAPLVTLQPGPPVAGLLVIPRRANNLFYNVSTPAQLVDEFNCYYSQAYVPPATAYPGSCQFPDGKNHRIFTQNLDYNGILDYESDRLLSYLVTWDLNPWMFHQPAIRAYDGTHSLIGDLLGQTLSKYKQYYSIPIRNLPEHKLGLLMADRMKYDQSGATAVWTPCASISISAANEATVPLTGKALSGVTSESYGGQYISSVSLAAGGSQTFNVGC